MAENDRAREETHATRRPGGPPRARALRDAATDVCGLCGQRAYPHRDAPLKGPNEAGNYTHHVHGTDVVNDQPCKASPIWSRVTAEWDLEETQKQSPRGFLVPAKKR